MSVTYLKSKHKKIDKIFHIADIHIRNVKRHDEYNEVLNRFYDSIKKDGLDNSLIIIAGDLAHSKLETSPELSKEIAELLTKCGDLTDTIVIPGNHDCNLNNRQRLDVISPIFDYLKHDRVHYVRDNGLYIMNNLLFSHFGIFADVEEYVTYKKIPKTYKDKTSTHIALYHGPLHKSTTDSNYEVTNTAVQAELFSGFHFGILGDIHKQQTIHIQKAMPEGDIPGGWVKNPNDENYIIKEFPIIRYPGSLVQQNHAEKIDGHGFTIWNVTEKSYKHVELHNDYGFFTVEVKNGKLSTDISDIPSKARLRFRCFETEPGELRKILETIKASHDIREVSYVRGDDFRSLVRGNISKISLQKLNDYHFQNQLIGDYLSVHKPKTSKKVLNKIFELNKTINSKLPEKDKPLNIIWKPKIFKFDNMFSYGEKNIVDFSKINGITGVFGPNACGKSSILSALCFCLFDKCDRTFKASHVLNDSKMSFKCELNFEIDGIDFYIKRTAKRDKKGNVSVKVDFYKIVDGERAELNDESRRSTNEIIRSYIGSYDDFVLTTLSLQKNQNNNFAEKGQTERKDLITKFLGIDIFDSLYQIALDDSKELSGKFKTYDSDKINKELLQLHESIKFLEEKYQQMVSVKDLFVQDHNDILKKIIEENSKIRHIEGLDESIDQLESKFENLSLQKDQLNITIIQNKIDSIKESIEKEKIKLSVFENDNIEQKFREFSDKESELLDIQSKIEMLKLDVKNKLEKVKFLDNHEYDEDCEYCMKNAFVQDALQAKQELNGLKPVVDSLISQKEKASEFINKNYKIKDEYTKFQNVKKEISGLVENLHTEQSEFIKCKSKESELQSKIDKCSDKIEKYYQSIDIAKENERINGEILRLGGEEKELSAKIKKANEKISDVKSDIKFKNSKVSEFENQKQEMEDLETEMKAYQLYIDAIHRDGVPYDIIAKSVPSIEKEVNEILSQIVEFGIMLDVDGKNINANLVYTDRLWPIEMGSGMESFISNLAMRIALSNISNVPRTNFLAIDEGFGSLDKDIFSSIPSLFSFLRNSFEFILIISHIDTVKDFVDGHIEINKDDKGFSNVVFN